MNRAHESIFDRSAYIVSGGRGEGGGEQLEACLEQSKGPYLLSSKKITLFASDGSVFGFEADGDDGSRKSKVEYDWQKTSLRGPFEHFQKQFLAPMWNELRRDRRAEAEEKAAMNGDF